MGQVLYRQVSAQAQCLSEDADQRHIGIVAILQERMHPFEPLRDDLEV